MEHLIAQAEQSTNSSALITVPIQTLPDFTYTQQCAYIAKVLRSNNIKTTSSVFQALRSKNSSTCMLLQGMIVRAISSVCTRVSPEEMAQANYINFYPSEDLHSSLFALERWLSDGVSISGVETVFEEGLINPVGDGELVASLVTLAEGQQFGERHIGLHVRICVKNTPQGIKDYIKSLDKSAAVGAEEGIKILLNGCETTLNAAALRAFSTPCKDKETSVWRCAIGRQMEMAIDNMVVTHEAAEALTNTIMQGQVSSLLMVVFTAKSDGDNPFDGLDLTDD